MSLLLALTDSVASVTGTVAFTEGNDTAAATATYGPTASAAYTEADDTAAATATFTSSSVTSTIAYTELRGLSWEFSELCCSLAVGGTSAQVLS